MVKQDLVIQKLNNIEKMLSDKFDEVLNFEQACQFLNVSRSYLYKLTSTRSVPHFKPRGKQVYFSKAELTEWLKQNPVKTSSEIDQEASDYLVNGE